jgi:hypothetical protein
VNPRGAIALAADEISLPATKAEANPATSERATPHQGADLCHGRIQFVDVQKVTNDDHQAHLVAPEPRQHCPYR